MIKKKKEKKVQKSSSLSSVLNLDKIFHNETFNFILGIGLALVAGFLTLAFVSYLSTGAADQSMIEDPREGEILNQNHEFTNTCGSLGAWCSWFFIKRCFGLPAFLIPLFLFLMGIHLTRAYKVNLWKWFFSLMFLMIWASVAMSLLLAPFFTDTCYSPGGDHGLYICHYIGNLVGTPGLTAILGLTAIAFLTYLSAETIQIIRKLLNPSKFIDRVKFVIANNDPNEKPDSYETQLGHDDGDDEDDEPTVFDNPVEQVVEFKEDHAVVIDKVYDDGQSDKAGQTRTTGKDVAFNVEETLGEEAANKKTMAQALEDLEPYDPKRDLENYH